MDRCALFVDAGYALADGAMAVHGTRRRDSVSWDHAGLLKLLAELARDRTGLPVLRCYWYEIAEGNRTAEQDALAEIPGLKLRLVNNRPGRREGIESQLRRDLFTLAKSGAISDAFVASADENVAELVSEIQDLGVRVVVLHIASDDGWTIPQSLRQECDDIVEISGVHLRPLVDLIRGAEPSQPEPSRHGAGSVTERDESRARTLADAARSRTGLPARALSAPTISAYQAAQLAREADDGLGASGGAHHAARAGEVPPGNPRRHGRDEGGQADDVLSTGRSRSRRSRGEASHPGAAPGDEFAAASPGAQAGDARLGRTGNGNGRYVPSQAGDANGAAAEGQATPGNGTGYGDATYGAARSGAANDFSRRTDGPSQSPYATGPQDAVRRPGIATTSASVPGSYQTPAVPPGYQGSSTSAGNAGFANGMANGGIANRNIANGGIPNDGGIANGVGQGGADSGFANDGFANGGFANGSSANGAAANGAAANSGPANGSAANGSASNRHGAREAVNGQGWNGMFDGGQGDSARVGDTRVNNGAGERPPPRPGDFQPAPVSGQSPASAHGPGPMSAGGRQPGSPGSGYPGAGPAGGHPMNGLTTPRQGVQAQQPAGGMPMPGQPPVSGRPMPGQPGAGQPAVGGPAVGGPPVGRHSPLPPPPQPQYRADPAYPGGQPVTDWEMANPAFQGRGAAPEYPPQHRPQQHQPQQHQPQQHQSYQEEPWRDAALPAVRPPQPVAVALGDAVEAAHDEGFSFGESVSRDAPGLWLEAVLARKPRMPSDLEARLLQTSVLPIDSLLHDEVRHSLRRGFWDALESARR